MKSNRWFYIFLTVILIVAGFAMADSLGWLSNKPYKAVPHGTHNHYVPLDRDPDVPLGEFPTQPPGPNQKITPDGRIVNK